MNSENNEIFLSIIIITKNEEKNLGPLLKSLGKLPSNVEIIVSDGKSTDRTVEIAKEHGCNIIGGGSPAEGRNTGGKCARGSYLYFSDADNVFPKHFITKLIKKIQTKKLEVGSTFMKVRIDRPVKVLDAISMFFINLSYFLLQKVTPLGFGPSMIIRKDIFEEIGGFDENLHVFEDNDFLKRAAKNHRYSYLTSPRPYFSTRRFDQDGRFITALRYVYWPIHNVFFQNKKMPKIFGNYEFGHYDKKKQND